RTARLLPVALLAAGLFAGAMAARLFWAPAATSETKPVVSSISATPEAVSAFTRGFALSPDASVLVYSPRAARGRYRLFRRPLADPRGDAIAGTEDGMYPFFSPNGQDIGFFAAGELKTVPLAGGPVHTIAKAPGSYPRGSWNTAGQILLSVGNAAG